MRPQISVDMERHAGTRAARIAHASPATPGLAGRELYALSAEGEFDMTAKGGKSNGGNFRSAVTGHYVKPQYAATHPKTTVHEAPPKKK